jgi:GDPmannose 4,6-dehydratase
MIEELKKKWLITGICGQDGSWFADYLLELGYTNIHGIMRRSATFNTQNIDHIFNKLKLYHGDLTDPMNIHNIISKVKPDYIVNFAAQSHVKVSHDLENYTFQVNTLGILNILQSVRNLGMEKTCRIYHASTSEMYGNQTDGQELLNEDSPMQPVSIYGISKKAAQEVCNMYRDAYGMFIVSSVLFNHEGSRRGHTFVTQKIADYVGKYYDTCNKYKSGQQGPFPLQPLQLGNLNARRDWGDAKDYVRAVYLMLTSDIPQNYVIATGETHSVREFVELAFKSIGIDMEWIGQGIDEVGVEKNNKKRILVQVNSRYYRDIDIECLIGDASKAKRELGWEPKVTFKELVKYMVKSAINRIGYWDLGTPYVSLNLNKN